MESTHSDLEVRFTGISTFTDLLTWNLQLGIKRWVKFAIALLVIIVISVVGNTLRFPRNFSMSFLGFIVVFAAAQLLPLTPKPWQYRNVS